MTISEQIIKEAVLKAIGDQWAQMDEVTAHQIVTGHQLNHGVGVTDQVEKWVMRRLYEAMSEKRVMPIGILGPKWWHCDGGYAEPYKWAPGKPGEMQLGECLVRAITVPVPEHVIWPRR